jgi:ribosomal protein S18 acetylase RimI-like enzyme
MPDSPIETSTVTVQVVTDVTPELVAGVARLIPQLSASAPAPSEGELADIVGSPGATLFVSRFEVEPHPIVGMLTLVVYRIPTGIHAVVDDVVVDERARGAGCGTALVSAALEHARKVGARYVDLTSRASRSAANRLYVRMGFEERNTNVYRYRQP